MIINKQSACERMEHCFGLYRLLLISELGHVVTGRALSVSLEKI